MAKREVKKLEIDQANLEAAVRALAAPLLGWFEKNARVLPWRSEPTPYRVWVSEIMLQQTRVSAVLPYFERFMKALPDIRALAAVSDEELMVLWQGLGYYSRARNLKRAAQEAVRLWEQGGEVLLPADYQALLKLPGIGEYTAGAIASIAYGIPVSAVDGNVLRVLSRIVRCEEDVLDPRVKRVFSDAVTAAMPQGRPGDFNQALMELGATVCLPNGAPLCAACPAAGLCEAYRAGDMLAYPVKAAKKPRRVEQRTVIAAVWRKPSGIGAGSDVLVYLTRRPELGLLSGLWELINLEGRLTMEEAKRAVRERGLEPRSALVLKEAKHVFSHVEWHMTGYLMEVTPAEGLFGEEEAGKSQNTAPDGARGKFVRAANMREKVALPSAFSAYEAALYDWVRMKDGGDA